MPSAVMPPAVMPSAVMPSAVMPSAVMPSADRRTGGPAYRRHARGRLLAGRRHGLEAAHRSTRAGGLPVVAHDS
ncbi:hypothetical protein BM536_031005 [Streptomyces phaeoluteigriseus]|uniref:Uncharacterized protein n=1 Tax=Streptomyces phaeoluteigriseus TaxID=114686 RepID=A0A1V6MJV9_9ACTN|nr:hypothetical protein BM536_031005 [Streptomyces phaeoluteigriseus]